MSEAGRDDVSITIESMISQLPNTVVSDFKIFKVNADLRRVNEKAYDPEIVAIGPIHHNKDHVKGMEQHKLRYLQQLLQRRNEQSHDPYVKKVRKLEERARKCYAESIQLPESDDFVRMLLLDGIFVIEVVRKCYLETFRDKNDYIFKFSNVLNQIRLDFLLLENQIPFFVLSELFNMTKTENAHDELDFLVNSFIQDMPLLEVDIKLPTQPNHLLEIFYRSNFPFESLDSSSRKQQCDNSDKYDDMNSASELEEAGIRFSRADKFSLKNISFTNGVMELPELNVSDETESVFRNLIAYEQFFPDDQPRYVTDYASFMECLVKSTKDVEILRRARVIKNWLGDDEAVQLMLNKLDKTCFGSSDFYHKSIYQSVNTHCSLRRKKWMATLKRKHCNSPWALVSILAGTVLLLLTVAQTVFSVLSYRKQI